MIKFITGKPGGGKSLRAVNLILEKLTTTQRTVVTNLPLHLDEVQEYCLKRGIEQNIFNRVVLLRKEEIGSKKETEYKEHLRNFFLFRDLSMKPFPKPATDDKGKYLEELEFPVETYGIDFFIDEIHKLWPARGFMGADPLVFEYLAEHRHFSDDVFFITQALAQVDKQIRLLGQDFEVIRNRKKEKYSIWAGPEKFTRYVFLSAPTGASNQSPSEKDSFLLNKEQAGCYSTSAKGGEGDKGQKAKGMPWWTFYAFGAAAVLMMIFLVRKAPMFMVNYVNPHKTALGTDKEGPAGRPAGDVYVKSDNVQHSTYKEPGQRMEAVITGLYAMTNGEGKIWLSDGRKIQLQPGVVDEVLPEGLRIKGILYRYANPGVAAAIPINDTPIRH